jgi:hypothetical protein
MADVWHVGRGGKGAKAVVALVCGRVKAYVNDPQYIGLAIMELNKQFTQELPVSGVRSAELAEAAEEIQGCMAWAAGRHCASMRDGIFLTKSRLSPSTMRKVRDLNVACSVARHSTALSLSELVTTVKRELEYSGCTMDDPEDKHDKARMSGTSTDGGSAAASGLCSAWRQADVSEEADEGSHGDHDHDAVSLAGTGTEDKGIEGTLARPSGFGDKFTKELEAEELGGVRGQHGGHGAVRRKGGEWRQLCLQ